MICVCFLDPGSEAEVVAGRPRPCGKTEFTCSNRRCIPMQLQCDLFNDCGDGGSDEQDCKSCEHGERWLQLADQRSFFKRCKVPNVTEVLSGSRAISSFQIWRFVVYDNLCVPTSEVCSVQDDWLRHPLGWCTSKEKPSSCARCKAVIKDLLLFPVSSGDVCGKKTNPCGEDAICNQTNVNAVCQCKPGFKRNQNTGLCEGNAPAF